MAASKLHMPVSLLPNKISTKFQQLHLYFRGLALHWDSWEDYVTNLELEKSKMVASKLQMHVTPFPDKISTKFRRLYYCFRGLAFHWDSWEYYATKPEMEKSKMAASKLQMHVYLLPDKISTLVAHVLQTLLPASSSLHRILLKWSSKAVTTIITTISYSLNQERLSPPQDHRRSSPNSKPRPFSSRFC